VGNSAWHGKALQGAGVVMETVWCDRNVGNAELHGAECQSTIH
jgi:hypothetical protein